MLLRWTFSIFCHVSCAFCLVLVIILFHVCYCTSFVSCLSLFFLFVLCGFRWRALIRAANIFLGGWPDERGSLWSVFDRFSKAAAFTHYSTKSTVNNRPTHQKPTTADGQQIGQVNKQQAISWYEQKITKEKERTTISSRYFITLSNQNEI